MMWLLAALATATLVFAAGVVAYLRAPRLHQSTAPDGWCVRHTSPWVTDQRCDVALRLVKADVTPDTCSTQPLEAADA